MPCWKKGDTHATGLDSTSEKMRRVRFLGFCGLVWFGLVWFGLVGAGCALFYCVCTYLPFVRAVGSDTRTNNLLCKESIDF